MKVSPSILATRLTRLGEVLEKLKSPPVDYIHLDIMDAHFVPPLTFGEQLAEAVRSETEIPLDVHLMVESPEKEVPKYLPLEPEILTFHYEASGAPIRLAEKIRHAGVKAGLALKPSTPIQVVEDLYPYFDLFLIMTVEPGYYGQSLLSNSWARLKQFGDIRQRMAEFSDQRCLLQVDGGVSDKNIGRLAEAGVDIVVAGAFVFQGGDPNLQVEILKENAKLTLS
ncbi:MAG: ribulose-phosphate 3-epimerase [Leptospiraceae bacterium]|nr:ribulose-phosphate 3-epimerase [Leptospiraceae bacterium]MDW8307441.1 ribulose-phosphate 3-epimerase [Leptospiraceae bacterium]